MITIPTAPTNQMIIIQDIHKGNHVTSIIITRDRITIITTEMISIQTEINFIIIIQITTQMISIQTEINLINIIKTMTIITTIIIIKIIPIIIQTIITMVTIITTMVTMGTIMATRKQQSSKREP